MLVNKAMSFIEAVGALIFDIHGHIECGYGLLSTTLAEVSNQFMTDPIAPLIRFYHNGEQFCRCPRDGLFRIYCCRRF